eukprot:204362_1
MATTTKTLSSELDDEKQTSPLFIPKPPRLTRPLSEAELDSLEEKKQNDHDDVIGLSFMMKSFQSNTPKALSKTPRNVHSDQFPLIFDPDQCFGDDSESMIQYNNYYNMATRTNQSFLSIMYGAVFLGATIFCDAQNFTIYISRLFIIMWVVFFLFIGLMLIDTVRSGRTLYKIYSETSIPPKWIRMSIATKQYIWLNKCINTISELCHVEGASTTTTLYAISISSWQFIIFFLVAICFKYPCDFKFDFVDFIMLIGVISIMFIGVFKADYILEQISNYNSLFRRFGYTVQQYYIGNLMKGICAITVCLCSWILFAKVMNDVIMME